MNKKKIRCKTVWPTMRQKIMMRIFFKCNDQNKKEKTNNQGP